MAREDGDTPRGAERAGEPHVSFIQRLRRTFGTEVEPINLQVEDEKVPEKGGTQGSSTPTSVQDFVKRLTPKVEVGNRYEIKQEVASGGMGTILRVWDEDLRRNLAMKVMHGRGAGSSVVSDGSGAEAVDPERLGRFLEEAQITGQLDHPGVVPVHDLGIDSKGRCFFTMRFVRGRELKDVLDLAREGKEGWTRTKVLGVILKVCEAMAYAHSKGVVHRDLKPSNVMVGRFGETYVMDWGLARVLGRRDSHDLRLKPQPGDASALSLVRTVRHDEVELDPDSMLVTMDGDVVGTPSYMSPEQARGKLEEVGPRSDVYSLGSILYYMLTGQTPYVKPGERLSPHTVLTRVLDAAPTAAEKLAPDEPPELIAICQKAMARDPEQRYASMLEVADDIQAFLENRVVRAYERGSLAEFKKWVVRNKGMAAGIAGMVSLLLAGALFFAWQQTQENERLSKKSDETARAKEAAEKNEARALASETMAKDNLDLAEQRRAVADRQTELAHENEERALRSGYAANILAADYSLKLSDPAEARLRLSATEAKLRGFEWKHLELLANSELADLGNYVNGVDALAFAPDGKRVFLLTGQGKLKAREFATLREVPPENIQVSARLEVSVRRLFASMAMDVSADGARLAVVGAGKNVHIFDLEAGVLAPGCPLDGLDGHGARTSAVAFSPDGQLLASGDDDGEIVLRAADGGALRQPLTGHLGQITALAWSHGSEHLASSSRDGTLRTWDPATGLELRTLRGHRGAVNAVAWDQSGERLFSCGEDGAVNMWEAGSGRLLRSFTGHEGAVLALDYDPRQGALVSGSADRTVRVWNVLTGSSTILRGHESPVAHVAFSPDGEFVLSSEKEGSVYLWDTHGDLTTTDLLLHRAAVNALVFSPDGKRLASASDDQEVVLWDATTGAPLRRLRGHKGLVNSVTFGPDGRTLLSGSQDKNVWLWDAESGEQLKGYGAFERWVEDSTLTPDGAHVIVSTGDRKVRILDAKTKAIEHELASFQFLVDELAVDAQSAHLATVSRDIQVWDLAGDLARAQFTISGRYSSVAFSPDGKRLASGALSGGVALWDAQNGTPLATMDDQKKQRLHCVAFSPDGKRLATGSDAGLIHVRDAETLATLLVLSEPQGAVLTLAFSPDGTRLAAGTKSGAIRIYETAAPAERRTVTHAAMALREDARARVGELFAQRFYLERVVHELEIDPALPRELREAALREAELRGDDPVPLFLRSIDECLDSERTGEIYALALARATAAEALKRKLAGSSTLRVSGKSDSEGWQLDSLSSLALGVASYRGAKYAEAERYLVPEPHAEQAEDKLLLFGKREQALRLLFLCMSQCQVAHTKDAERSWRVAQQNVLNDVELSQRPELTGLLAEAETMVRSSGASGS